MLPVGLFGPYEDDTQSNTEVLVWYDGTEAFRGKKGDLKANTRPYFLYSTAEQGYAKGGAYFNGWNQTEIEILDIETLFQDDQHIFS